MILQALNDYYKRLAEDESSDIPRFGSAERNCDWVVVIRMDGTFEEAYSLKSERNARRTMAVPFPAIQKEKAGFRLIPKRTSHLAPYFLWDKTDYALGNNGAIACPEHFEAFRQLHHHLCDKVEDEHARALLRFLDGWIPEEAPNKIEEWSSLAGSNIVFKIKGQGKYIHESQSLACVWRNFIAEIANPIRSRCMILQKEGPLARAHPPIRNMFRVSSNQKAEGTLVGINADAAPAFVSYGLGNMMSPPVSEEAAFNYTTALNDLLRRDSRQKVQIGDATTVFWTEKKTQSESLLPWAFSQSEDQGDLQKLRLFLEAARDGKMPDELKDEGKVRTFVLGLAPNAARISVRFWHVDTVAGLWGKIGQHFADLKIVKQFDKEPEFPPQWLLLKAAAKLEDLDNLSPLLSGALMRSILTGAAYPGALLSAVMGRIRSEQKISYARAALIKACLVRNARLHGQTPEVSVSLDEQSTNVPYRLGRLFAVLEKLQQEAIPGANTTIKDRYFGSASATPRAVFPVLLRLSQHHISKIEYGRTYDKHIQDILNGVDIATGGFPAHLSLEDQGLFALGYYHQRKDLWTSKKNAAAAPETATATTEG